MTTSASQPRQLLAKTEMNNPASVGMSYDQHNGHLLTYVGLLPYRLAT